MIRMRNGVADSGGPGIRGISPAGRRGGRGRSGGYGLHSGDPVDLFPGIEAATDPAAHGDGAVTVRPLPLDDEGGFGAVERPPARDFRIGQSQKQVALGQQAADVGAAGEIGGGA
jgi:hypothetical protein